MAETFSSSGVWAEERERERERETTDSYTDTLSGPSEAAVSRPLIGQSPRVAVFLLARCVAVQAPWPSLDPGLLHTGPRVSCWPERNSDEALSL